MIPYQYLSRLPLSGGDWESDGLCSQRLGGSGQKTKGHQRAQADSEPGCVGVGVATFLPLVAAESSIDGQEEGDLSSSPASGDGQTHPQHLTHSMEQRPVSPL